MTPTSTDRWSAEGGRDGEPLDEADLRLRQRRRFVAVVAVLVNLYPVATVLLAWIVLRERINAVQGTGVVLAVAASVMLGLA